MTIDIDGYLNNNGHGCPNCDEATAKGGEITIDDGITQEMSCSDCDASWTNHYELIDITVIHEGKQYAYTDEEEVRAAFALYAKSVGVAYYSGYSQNEQPCDTRTAFVDWIDGLARDGSITQTLASEVTL